MNDERKESLAEKIRKAEERKNNTGTGNPGGDTGREIDLGFPGGTTGVDEKEER